MVTSATRSKRRWLASGVVSIAVLVGMALPESAGGCTCVPSNLRADLALHELAFVGVVTEADRSDGSTRYTVDVVEAIKGEPGSQVHIRAGNSEAGCGIQLPVDGHRLGLIPRGEPGELTVGLCGGVYEERALREAAGASLDPESTAPLAAIVAGRIAEARIFGIDEVGAVVAYGTGSGHTTDLALCPGGKRFLELVDVSPASAVVTRDLETFETHGDMQVPVRIAEPLGFTCWDEDGSHWTVGQSSFQDGDGGQQSEVVASVGGEIERWQTPGARAFAAGADGLLVLTGTWGVEIEELDWRTGDRRSLASVGDFLERGWAITATGRTVVVFGSTSAPDSWWSGPADRAVVVLGASQRAVDIPQPAEPRVALALSDSLVGVVGDGDDGTRLHILDIGSLEVSTVDDVWRRGALVGERLMFVGPFGALVDHGTMGASAQPRVLIDDIHRGSTVLRVEDGPVIRGSGVAGAFDTSGPPDASAESATVADDDTSSRAWWGLGALAVLVMAGLILSARRSARVR